MVTIIPRPVVPGSVNMIRRPRQKRSQQRFEAILDSAARLLTTLEPEQVGVYTLAEEAGLSPPSIYHFFPDAGQIFVALAERYYKEFVGLHDLPLPLGLMTWQQHMAVRFSMGRAHYNASPRRTPLAARLGPFRHDPRARSGKRPRDCRAQRGRVERSI